MAALAKDTSRFVETSIDDEVVVMALDTGEFFSLQDTARAIWELIDGTRSRDEIVASLAQRYSQDATAIVPEVDVFVADLRSAGLLHAG